MFDTENASSLGFLPHGDCRAAGGSARGRTARRGAGLRREPRRAPSTPPAARVPHPTRLRASSPRRASSDSAARTSPASSTSKVTCSRSLALRHRSIGRSSSRPRQLARCCQAARCERPAAAPAAAGGGAPARSPHTSARRRRDRAPLRRVERLLRAAARPVAHLLVRGVVADPTSGSRPRRREARARVPQARAATGHAAARRRLRVGEHAAPRGAAPRRARRRRHAVAGAGRARARSAIAEAGLTDSSRSACRTTATCATARSTRSARSACSSTSGSRKLDEYFARSVRLLRPGGRLLNHGISRALATRQRRAGVRARAASSTATCSPTASCTRSARSCRDPGGGVRGPPHGEPARALRPHAAGLGREPRSATGTTAVADR